VTGIGDAVDFLHDVPPASLTIAKIIAGVADVHRAACEQLAGLKDHDRVADAERTGVESDDDGVNATRSDQRIILEEGSGNGWRNCHAGASSTLIVRRFAGINFSSCSRISSGASSQYCHALPGVT
jgi:hypothetical protein